MPGVKPGRPAHVVNLKTESPRQGSDDELQGRGAQRVYPAASSLSARRNTFPTFVFGSESRNTIVFGRL